MGDFKKLLNELPAGISGAPTAENIMRWEAVIFGPEKSYWEGGTFRLTLEFTEEYPTKAPLVKFKAPIFHPNIYSDGNICLDILNKQWSAQYDVSAILRSIQLLLCDPNTSSPANAEAAKLYESDKVEYARRVKETVERSWDFSMTF
jgi:ubiquitin-conjugating enzyme E2 A